LIDHLGKLWDEWEIQVLVLASFALQVLLLMFSGFRKRRSPGVVSTLLWLAYLSADSLATFVLGHLALHMNGPRHGLTLFWAPFMLLHLGGQETITAFSMEDNVLWKRHLLNLVTQVGLAAYVVGRQWQGDRQLVAPMVLMFIAGTFKYAGRTSALMFAAKPAPYIGTEPRGMNIARLYDSGIGVSLVLISPVDTACVTTYYEIVKNSYLFICFNEIIKLGICLDYKMSKKSFNFTVKDVQVTNHR
jgi:hypothetical protein